MKAFWALPAVLRAALASKQAFSVTDDILAFPQFEIKYSQGYVTESRARVLLSGDDSYNTPTDEPDSTALQHQDAAGQIVFGDDKTKQAGMTYETLFKHGRRYLCGIPEVKLPTREEKNATQALQEERAEMERANIRGWELLSRLNGQCMYYSTGWWTYQYCYGWGVKQFHQLPPQPGLVAGPPVEDPSVHPFMLGTIDPPQGNEVNAPGNEVAAVRAGGTTVSKGGVKYLVQNLDGGTVCDLTGKERKIEVQFHCSLATGDRIDMIKELATCTYLMVVKTPKLCDDVAFLPPQRDEPNSISCAPILSPAEVPSWKAAIDQLRPDQPPIPNPFQSPPRPRVGNYEIGAHTIIPEGRDIPKSNVVGGPASNAAGETLVDTIATSEGVFLTPDQLKELGINQPERINELRKQLDRIAGDKGWKLEVIDTPNGREYRGIIGDGSGESGDAVKGEPPSQQEVQSEEERKKAAVRRATYEQEKYEAQLEVERKKKKQQQQQQEGREDDEVKQILKEGAEDAADERQQIFNAEGGSVEEVQEQEGGKDGDTEDEHQSESHAERLQRRKQDIMDALMEREGAEEIVVLWDDGDGDISIEQQQQQQAARHDEL